MANTAEYAPVLARYPADCQPSRVECLEGAGGFSGARFWRLTTPRGLLCLRRWPTEYPTVERLQFIQAVLWHVNREGFDLSPLPLEADSHAGFVEHQGALWQLEPWMPGVADYHASPSDAKLRAALTALAEFHLAAASFPLADNGPLPSPRLLQAARPARCSARRTVRSPGGRHSAGRLAGAGRAGHAAGAAGPSGSRSRRGKRSPPPSRSQAPIQPCIGDVWHDHVLFLGDA